MRFECLVIKKYRNTLMTKQLEIVRSLGAKQHTDFLWHIDIADDVTEVKRIEAALSNKVPFRKIPDLSKEKPVWMLVTCVNCGKHHLGACE